MAATKLTADALDKLDDAIARHDSPGGTGRAEHAPQREDTRIP